MYVVAVLLMGLALSEKCDDERVIDMAKCGREAQAIPERSDRTEAHGPDNRVRGPFLLV